MFVQLNASKQLYILYSHYIWMHLCWGEVAWIKKKSISTYMALE